MGRQGEKRCTWWGKRHGLGDNVIMLKANSGRTACITVGLFGGSIEAKSWEECTLRWNRGFSSYTVDGYVIQIVLL